MRSFESDTHTFSSKAPTTPSLRRNRSMPAVEFQIHHPSNFISSSDNPSFLQQIQYHGELSPENGQSSVPNSTSMDALESILRANSEDWNDAWHQMSSQQYVYDLPDDDSANTPKILQEISPHIPDTPNHVQRKKLIPVRPMLIFFNLILELCFPYLSAPFLSGTIASLTVLLI